MSDPYAMFRALTAQINQVATMLESPLAELAASVEAIDNDQLRAEMATEVAAPLFALALFRPSTRHPLHAIDHRLAQFAVEVERALAGVAPRRLR